MKPSIFSSKYNSEWKLVAMCLLMVCLYLSFLLYQEWNKKLDFGGLEVKERDLKAFAETTSDDVFEICDYKKELCVRFRKIP